MTWIAKHANVITAFANVGMLLIWAFYAQLFYRNFKRYRRPRIIIDQMSGQAGASTCVVTNMSQEMLYLKCILVAGHDGQNREILRKTDCQEAVSSMKQGDQEIISQTRQGPLSPGEILTVSTFPQLGRRVVSKEQTEEHSSVENPNQSFEIRVIATVSSEDRPIGARRGFRIEPDHEKERIKPLIAYTKLMTSRSEIKEVTRWLESVMYLA